MGGHGNWEGSREGGKDKGVKGGGEEDKRKGKGNERKKRGVVPHLKLNPGCATGCCA